ncbi:MAG: hypothetical protein GF320_17200, partial [Armatimonadia bacterium]|nr:hypothetical protein [Armatimonadia bacterium]
MATGLASNGGCSSAWIAVRTDPASKTFEWAYDALGQRQRETDADSGHMYFDYDALARLATIKNPQAEEFGFGYDDASRLVRKTLASGALTYHSYDAAGRPSRIAHAKSDLTVIASYDYDRARRSRIPGLRRPPRSRRRDSASDGPTCVSKWTRAEPDAARMCRDSGGTVQDRKLYYYDPASNRERMEQDGQPTVYYHYDARNAMTQVDPAGGTATDMAYDAAGNLISETEGSDVTEYTWNADGLMERADLPSGLTNYFAYDGAHRRWPARPVFRPPATPAIQSTRLRLRWAHTRLWLDPGGARRCTHVPDYTHDQGVTIMPGVGTILSVHEDSASHFFHTDAQGTTRTVTDPSEATEGAFDLDAFGVLRSQSGTFSTPYLYTGKERDPNPNLDYFVARQYAAPLGVFVSKDPLGPSEGWYLYVGASPMMKWDPEGAAPYCAGADNSPAPPPGYGSVAPGTGLAWCDFATGRMKVYIHPEYGTRWGDSNCGRPCNVAHECQH